MVKYLIIYQTNCLRTEKPNIEMQEFVYDKEVDSVERFKEMQESFRKQLHKQKVLLNGYKILSYNLLKSKGIDSENKEIMSFGNLTINPLTRQMSISGKVVTTTQREFSLIEFFAENANIALSRDRILDNVWGLKYIKDPRTVDTFVKRLRQKLGEPHSWRIQTLEGYGYQFMGDN